MATSKLPEEPLTPEAEAIVDAVLKRAKQAEQARRRALVERIRADCEAKGLRPPSRSTIIRRLEAFLEKKRQEELQEQRIKRREAREARLKKPKPA